MPGTVLEKTRNTKRRELFDTRDSIDVQREELIEYHRETVVATAECADAVSHSVDVRLRGSMTMTQNLQQKSPNEILAEELVRRLLEAGLIPKDHGPKNGMMHSSVLEVAVPFIEIAYEKR